MAEPLGPDQRPDQDRPAPGRSAAGAEPEDAVRREARLLAAALAASLRAQVRPDPSDAGASAGDESPAGQGPGYDAPPPPRAEGPPRADSGPRTDSAALSEVLAGAGLMARGGLELMGGVMARLVEVSSNPPDAGAAAAGGGPEEPDGAERGQARVARYRRTQRREVPVIDDPGRTDLE